MTYNPEKNQLIYSDPEIIKMIKLVDKDVKFTIINVQNHKSWGKYEHNERYRIYKMTQIKY